MNNAGSCSGDQELLRSQPSLAVLFVSGYPGEVLSDNGLLDPGIELLPKPLQVDALLVRVAEVLAKNGIR